MKILFIGKFDNRADEGLSGVSKEISHSIESRGHTTLKVTPTSLFKWNTFLKILDFSPSIIHYLTGPTIRSLFILKFLKFVFPKSITVSSATRPFFSKIQYGFIRPLKPDLILTQDTNWERLFISLGISTRFFPNGVHTTRFSPNEIDDKVRTKNHFGIPLKKKILLHVGHIRKNRNLGILIDIQKKTDWFIVLVASSAIEIDKELFNLLISNGILVINQYISNIEQIYAASDAYIFPTIPPGGNQLPQKYNQVGVIDMPLSLLEAMATNLPVFTTPFSSFTRHVNSGGGVFYFDGTFSDFVRKQQNLIGCQCNTREVVKKMDWAILSEELDKKYMEALAWAQI